MPKSSTSTAPIFCAAPRIGPVAEQMRSNIGDGLGCDQHRINVKGKTNDGVRTRRPRRGDIGHSARAAPSWLLGVDVRTLALGSHFP